ncbi:MAG: hypothetical protein K9L89_05250 [Kiritimatiellales bacterium]|nr:hypothetical protein [Kiritimatiellales bacterium]
MAATTMLTGCASFSRNQLPAVGNLQRAPFNAQKVDATYSFSAGMELFGKQEFPENTKAMLKKEFTGVMKDSGCFASLSAGAQGGMHMDVRLVNSGSASAMIPAVITGLSLYIIPSWATDHYDATVTVMPPDGRERTYKLGDAMTTVQWLPMIVVAPFKNLVGVSEDVRVNIWKNLVVRMQKDGLLPAAEAGQTTLKR